MPFLLVFQILTPVTDACPLRPQRINHEEFELDFDFIPTDVLTELYKFVIPPLRATRPKQARIGRGTGRRFKRKRIDDYIDPEKIRALEARIALFDNNAAANNGDASHGAGA